MKLNRRLSSESATSTRVEHWHQIPWDQVFTQVRGLQIRIAKATKEEDWRKVKALQRFLTRSFYGRCVAVRRVTENAGKRTPGVDGVTWSTPASKWTAIQQLTCRGYRPKPLRRVYIPKANGKRRPLGIPTMKDRAMQALFLLALEPVSETLADQNSYGFRRERSTTDAIAQLFNLLSRKGAAQWVLEADIEGCFDHISHEWLESNVPMDKTVLRKWLKAGYVESRQLFPTEAGTPQGGIISPTLANVALDGLEKLLNARFRANQWLQRKYQVALVRYADDFVITGNSPEVLENEVRPMVEEFLAQRGLRLSAEKTRITHIAKGFDFLGQNVRKYDGKLLIKPSTKNVKAFLEKVRGIIRGNKQLRQDLLIRQLNPVIRGWANYHRGVVASKTFSDVDYHIWWALWRWAKRRHPQKGRKWIRSHYYRSIGSEHGVFCSTFKAESGQPAVLRLLKASHVRIKRHVKVRWDANPFDPADDAYFAERKLKRMANRLEDQTRLSAIWKRQSGTCPVCKQLFDDGDTWHKHHQVPRVEGGTDEMSNLALLHPTCHRQHHARNGQ